MIAEENNTTTGDEQNVEVPPENAVVEEKNDHEEQTDETLIGEDLTGSSEEDLETQMATAMAAESLDDSSEKDELETQMAAAMAEGEDDTVPENDDLEAQLSAAAEIEEEKKEELESLLKEEEDSGIPVQKAQFQQLVLSDEEPDKSNINRLLDVGLNLSVELGRKEMQIKDILNLGPGKIIELDKLAGEPVDLLVNGKLLAKGEVVVVDENFGVRITELVNTIDRIKMLHR